MPRVIDRVPRVSVVISTFNRATLLPATLDSVLAQTMADFELIVVDDGSTDETARVVERYGTRVRYVFQENRERGAARNHGLRLASGEFVALLDSDDLWTPRKLEAEVDYADRRPDVGLVYSSAAHIDEGGRVVRRVRTPAYEGDVLRHIVRRNFIPFGANIVRRSLLLACGGFNEDRRLAGSEDWELWTRLAAQTRFGRVADVGLLYRQHAGASVTNVPSMRRSMRRAFFLMYANPDLVPRITRYREHTLAHIDLVAGSLSYAANRPAEARRLLYRAAKRTWRVVPSRHFLGLALRLAAGRRLTRAGQRFLRPSMTRVAPGE